MMVAHRDGGTQVILPREPSRLDRSLGVTLRAARQAAGLTMQELAARSGVSQPHLSQMENGKVSPSINTLYRLANALQVSPQDLLPAGPPSALVVVRNGEAAAAPIFDGPNAATARVLLGAPHRNLQVQEVVVEPGQALGEWFDHDGEEFVYIIEGSLVVELEDAEPVELGAGDSASYTSSIPHRWRAAGDESVRMLAVSSVTPSVRRPSHG